MKNIILCISLVLILVCIPTKTWGQYVVKENMGKVTQAVIIYTEGVYPGAVWPLGMVLRDPKTKATFRHTEINGNGNNVNANSKLPTRILIAPTDLPTKLSWSQAMGFTDASNNNLDETAATNASGCASYKIESGTVFPGYSGITEWRLPTQRELQLIWLLHDAIDQAFLPKYSSRSLLDGEYWSSTEASVNPANAWYLNFEIPKCDKIPKTTQLKVRCVSDY